MMSFKRDKKEEEEGGTNPFANVEKTAVLQEARQFNETPVNVRKCTYTLTKILFLINQGEQLGVKEATDAFFAMTKLFQSRDVILRRLVYLGIKELSNVAEDVIIVTSSLTKDMTGKEDMYRAAAIRALCSITDASMLQTIERYMKQAIVDRNPAVSSAALVSSLHISKLAPEVVKRWVNEVQEASSTDNIMVQYHALGVLYHIKKNDRLAVTKLMAKLTKSPLRSPYAVCMLIRIACKLLEDEDTPSNDSNLFNFIESCLRHKNEMVIYEAAHAIANLRKVSPRELASAVCVLIQLCNNSKPTLRFAAVRTLNKVAMTHPSVVTASNMDLEALITDPNRSIATLAITTLLKTGSESSVDRLMKQISTFVNEISDEFKIVVVQAIRSLCLKFPRKHSVLMTFLSAMLRDEGGLDYKAAIADTIITVIEDNPEAKEMGLAHLCEFIEDCEHTSLAVRILHLLGREGPLSKQPSRYIRFIYNRVILESAPVRAAAVAAMAQFGALCPDLRENILVLLDRCQMDTDDEVRDRATYYHSILSSGNNVLINHYIVDIIKVSIPALEKALLGHLSGRNDKLFDISVVPIAAVEPSNEAKSKIDQDTMFAPSAQTQKKLVLSAEELFIENISQIPELSALPGPVFKSSKPCPLTESETEYVVTCSKHSYANHLVLQFSVNNTLNDQLLENVRVELDIPQGYELLLEVPIEKITCGEKADFYALLKYPEDVALSVSTFGATLKFTVKDCDPMTGLPDSDEGYQDEYILEDFDLCIADQIQKISKGNFNMAWEEESDMTEVDETFNMSNVKSLAEAVDSVVKFLDMWVADKTDKIPEGKSSHTLLLSGQFRGGFPILVRAKMALAEHVAMKLTIKSNNSDVADLIMNNVG